MFELGTFMERFMRKPSGLGGHTPLAIDQEAAHLARVRAQRQEWQAEWERKAREMGWNPYFYDFLKKHDLGEMDAWYLTGPRSVRMFRCINMQDLLSIREHGMMPIDELVKRGMKSAVQYVDHEEQARGEGAWTHWAIGKVNTHFGLPGKGQVLVTPQDESYIRTDSVKYRRGDSKQHYRTELPLYQGKDLSLEKLPPDYWDKYFLYWEARVPEIIPFDALTFFPMDNVARGFMDSHGLAYPDPSVFPKYPMTTYVDPMLFVDVPVPMLESAHDEYKP